MLKNLFLAYGPVDLKDILQADDGKSISAIAADAAIVIGRFAEYSPAVLVDRLVLFKSLDEPRRDMIRETLAERFHNAFPSEFVTDLGRKTAIFVNAAKQFWLRCASAGDGEELRVAHTALREAGLSLAETLEELPKGIWLS